MTDMTKQNSEALAFPPLPAPFDTGPVPKYSADQMNARYVEGYEAGRAAISADRTTHAANQVPAGFVLVPRELLQDAAESIDDYRAGTEFGSHDRKLLGRLKTMIAAAPSATAQVAPEAAEVGLNASAALSYEQIATFGLGLEYVHSVLCWAACGYMHTPERIAQLHTSYRIIDRLVNAALTQPPAAPASDKPTQLELALRALHYYQTECTGAEPSVSVFHRMCMEALCYGEMGTTSPQAPAPQAVVGEASEARLIEALLAVQMSSVTVPGFVGEHAISTSTLAKVERALGAYSLTVPAKDRKRLRVTVCCGRIECGGECGNEWAGMEDVSGTPSPAPNAAHHQPVAGEIDRLTAERDSALRGQENFRSQLVVVTRRLEALNKALAAPHQGADALREAPQQCLKWSGDRCGLKCANADAERYRWLIDSAHSSNRVPHLTQYAKQPSEGYVHHRDVGWDAAIDAARAALAQHQAPQQGEQHE